MTMEKATSSTSNGNDSEVESQVRPTVPPDLFQAALKGNGQVLVTLLGLPAEEQNHITVPVDAQEPNTQQIEGNIKKVKYMLKSTTAFGNTVLHILIANRYNDLALKVFQKEKSLLKAKNKNLETPLHYAAKVGNIYIIEQLTPSLTKHVLKETNNDGDTALHLAVKNNRANVAKKLHEINQELIYKINKKGFFPLHITIENQLSVGKEILKSDFSLAFTQFSNGAFPVHIAASMGNTDMILFLLEENPDYVNLLDPNGQNFFHIAADKNKIEIFTEELINDCKNILNDEDYEGNTPLHIAILRKNNEIVKAIRKSFPSFRLFSVERHINEAKEEKNIWERVQVVGLGAVLIATISFAAAFTFPGGYNADGEPVLGKKTGFQNFIGSNAVTFLLSFISVFLLAVNDRPNERVIRAATLVFITAAAYMLITFGLGTELILATNNKTRAKFLGTTFYVVAFGSLSVYIYKMVQTSFLVRIVLNGYWKIKQVFKENL